MAKNARWLVPVVLGFGVAALAIRAYTWAYPVYPKEVMDFVRGTGIQPRTGQRILDLEKAFENRKPVSIGEWSETRDLLNSTNAYERGWALILMGRLTYTTYRNEVVSLAKSHLNDAGTFVQANAMIALYR